MEGNNTSLDSTMDSLERLRMENVLLLEENRKLSETIDWMHDTIWRLVRTQRPEN
ncbi:MAG: hypothetical protein HFH36_02935 [Lachnospiraceae bacterium]|nr:hypothetical protein [Lachnospiraceae bacterium]